jgi:UDP-N-acetylmuramyl pentapeptide phosphotransferase/UDP-N-acetylglucosamine-1-phosphate transferase
VTLIVLVELFAELEYMGRIRWKISPVCRFVIHSIAACLALYISGISGYEFIIGDYVFVLPNWLLYLLFAGWSVFVINAVNRIDGIYAQGNGILTI